MTPLGAAVLQAIRDLTVDGVPPSFDEIRTQTGLASKGQVHRLVRRLCDEGYVAWLPHRARSLRLTVRSELDGLGIDQLIQIRADIDARLDVLLMDARQAA